METVQSRVSSEKREPSVNRGKTDPLLDLMRSVVQLEAAALHELAGQVGEGYLRALRLMQECRGKIVLTGVGKSGIIAKKIAATLSSTGTIATFLHPADGLHGDLGVVSSEDVVVAIGKSGESDELLALLPALRSIGVKIIAITGRADSTLASAAEIVLLTPVNREACPHNLAPTVSTTMALAVGDALAIGLMQAKNFQPENFALYHPGGKLGKRLLLRVADLMIPKDRCPILSPKTATMEEVIVALSQYGLGVVLFGEGNQLTGLVTDGDIRRLLQTHRQAIFDLPVQAFMNAQPQTITAGQFAVDALQFMEARPRPLNVVPVLQGTEIAGVLRLHELLAVS